jgi:hypothetical protein
MEYNSPNQHVVPYKLTALPLATIVSSFQRAFDYYHSNTVVNRSRNTPKTPNPISLAARLLPAPSKQLKYTSTPHHFKPTSLPRRLSNSFVSVAVVPLLTVRKKPVDDDAADGEDKDEDGPQELVADGTAGLEDLDWKVALAYCVLRWWW